MNKYCRWQGHMVQTEQKWQAKISKTKFSTSKGGCSVILTQKVFIEKFKTTRIFN